MDYELIAKVLFENYETIYDVNLNTHEYRSFHESEAYKKLGLETEGRDFFESLPDSVRKHVYNEDQDYVLYMLSKDNLTRGLDKSKYYTFIYRIKKGDQEIYHQIIATLQPTEDGDHVYMGVRNVDDVMKQEVAHRDELSYLQQKEAAHMRAVLASSAAYMEANLTSDTILEKSDDNPNTEDRFIKKIPSINEIPSYSELHKWICENLVVKNKEKYEEIGSSEYLLNRFNSGELRASVQFSVYTKENGVQPCREVFFLYKKQGTEDVHVFCVIYDLTEQQKKEQELERLEYELRMSRIRNFTSQMQPHFLYNALGSIQEVILMDPEYASELLGHFTVHLRSCVRAMTRDEPLIFSQELENIEAYVAIEKMRLGEKLAVEYDIEVSDFQILPLTVQPLVENAIRHGIYHRGVKGGTVYIRTREDLENWIIEIEDNGVGFDVKGYKERQALSSGDSTGIHNVRFRLEKVMGARLNVKSTVGEGTIATIRIPKSEGKSESDNSR